MALKKNKSSKKQRTRQAQKMTNLKNHGKFSMTKSEKPLKKNMREPSGRTDSSASGNRPSDTSPECGRYYWAANGGLVGNERWGRWKWEWTKGY